MKKSIALVAATTLALSSLSFNAIAAQKNNCDTTGGWLLGGLVGGGFGAVAMAAGATPYVAVSGSSVYIAASHVIINKLI